MYNPPKNELREIGEFGLIERMKRMVAQAGLSTAPAGTGTSLVVGIGDDAAAWRTGEGVVLATTDSMVDGVHFTRATVPWQDVGWKVMAVNLSDIAAMGGTPAYALVTLGLPDDITIAAIDSLYQGMIQVCQQYGTAIVGGDIVKSRTFFVTVALFGTSSGKLLLRSTARVGDLLAVTGPLGGSGAGLQILTRPLPVDPEAVRVLQSIHRRPAPRVREGQVLAAGGVVAAMDISDGLVADLGKMMVASGVAAQLDAAQIPVHPLLRRGFARTALQLALAGGEDYELLYAAPEAVMQRTLTQIRDAAVIGRVVAGVPGQVTVRDQQGQEVKGVEGGWDHFRT